MKNMNLHLPRLLAVSLVLVAPLLGAGCQSAAAPGGSAGSSTAADPSSSPLAARGVQKSSAGTNPGHAGKGTPLTPAAGHELAAFAEGCFWGSENTFRHVAGVTATAVGYTGGHTEAPTYETVCSHTTGHAEAVLVEFDPKVVSYRELVRVFYKTHDPTTKNRQGPDVGDQYRSAVFTFNDEQAKIVAAVIAEEQPKLQRPITTEVSPIPRFYMAEDYHQQYDEKSGHESCPLPLR
jgi:peptide-methionine (S)-S-oxide reductase